MKVVHLVIAICGLILYVFIIIGNITGLHKIKKLEMKLNYYKRKDE